MSTKFSLEGVTQMHNAATFMQDMPDMLGLAKCSILQCAVNTLKFLPGYLNKS